MGAHRRRQKTRITAEVNRKRILLSGGTGASSPKSNTDGEAVLPEPRSGKKANSVASSSPAADKDSRLMRFVYQTTRFGAWCGSYDNSHDHAAPAD